VDVPVKLGGGDFDAAAVADSRKSARPDQLIKPALGSAEELRGFGACP
jgi:hypothetical protein